MENDRKWNKIVEKTGNNKEGRIAEEK